MAADSLQDRQHTPRRREQGRVAVGETEEQDPLHLDASLVRDLRRYPGQEIASLTFSATGIGWYGEPGQQGCLTPTVQIRTFSLSTRSDRPAVTVSETTRISGRAIASTRPSGSSGATSEETRPPITCSV